jgi:hypothetical protein
MLVARVFAVEFAPITQQKQGKNQRFFCIKTIKTCCHLCWWIRFFALFFLLNQLLVLGCNRGASITSFFLFF